MTEHPHPDLADLAAPTLTEPERLRAAALRLRRVAELPGMPREAQNIVAALATTLTLASQIHDDNRCAAQLAGRDRCLPSQIAAAVLGDPADRSAR